MLDNVGWGRKLAACPSSVGKQKDLSFQPQPPARETERGAPAHRFPVCKMAEALLSTKAGGMRYTVLISRLVVISGAEHGEDVRGEGAASV